MEPLLTASLWALHLVGEAHPRAERSEFEGIFDVLLFGIDGPSLALARKLKAQGWQVKLVDTRGRFSNLVTETAP